MNKETISDKQGISLIIMFLVGTTTLSIFGIEAKESYWLSIIISIVIALLIVLILIRLNDIFPDKDLFDIIEICFGKFLGRIVIILFICFFLEEGMFVLINFGQFVNITTLTETPSIIIKISIMILCILIIKRGIEVMGRWAEFMIFFFIPFVLISILLSIPNMDVNNVLPILDTDAKSILKGSFSAFTFPFGEIVAFAVVFSGFQTRKSCKKIYILGLLIGGILLLINSSANVLVLGVDMASTYYYSAYLTFTIINIGDFVQRIEVLLAIVHVLGAVIKISIYFFAASKGIAKIFNCNNYRVIVVPVGLVMINLSYFYFDSVMNFWEYNNEIWPYYAILFEMIFPIVIITIAEIKNRRLKTTRVN